MVQLTGQLAYLQQAHLLCQSMQDSLSAAMVSNPSVVLHYSALPARFEPMPWSCSRPFTVPKDKLQAAMVGAALTLRFLTMPGHLEPAVCPQGLHKASRQFAMQSMLLTGAAS